MSRARVRKARPATHSAAALTLREPDFFSLRVACVLRCLLLYTITYLLTLELQSTVSRTVFSGCESDSVSEVKRRLSFRFGNESMVASKFEG